MSYVIQRSLVIFSAYLLLENLFIDFLRALLLSVNRKDNSYNAIFDIIDCLTKMMHYQLFKTTIDTAGLVGITIYMMENNHSLTELIINNQGSLFTSKF